MKNRYFISSKFVLLFSFFLSTSIAFSQPCNTYDTITTSSCDVYTAPSGVQYDTSGIYNDTILNVAGCDSIITISLIVNYSYSTTIFILSCGLPYISDAGISYCCNGTYQEIYLAINGCDSVVYIELDMSPADGNIADFMITTCDHWTAPDGTVLTSSGMYYEFFPGGTAVYGCDSANHYYVTIHTIDSTSNWVGAMSIEANEIGATYQWVDCNNNNIPIPGATNKIFIASVNGDYACIVSNQFCTKTTNCVRVESLGLVEEKNQFGIYPNPSKGVFFIELISLEAKSVLEITDITGKIVFQSELKQSKLDIDLSNVEPGLYFISIISASGSAKKSVIIK